MEDALALSYKTKSPTRHQAVLILVVMEDALAQTDEIKTDETVGSLNPCCNGRCTRTHVEYTYYTGAKVLILVVMEDALALNYNTSIKTSLNIVLILVVMEDALAQIFPNLFSVTFIGLNPCCNGRCTRTITFCAKQVLNLVLILVVMEDALALRETF